MTFTSPALSDRPSAAASRPPSARPRASIALARRRRALLELARRHGEVRLRLTSRAQVVSGAAEVSDLLDGLNGDGLLRFGGLRAVEGDRELVYLLA